MKKEDGKVHPDTEKKSHDYIVFGAPDIGEDEISEVVDTLRSRWIGTGPKVHKFEKAFSEYKGNQELGGVALGSCTSALHLSLLALGVGPGDEVITSAMTFCATVNAIIHAGATPVIADVDPQTKNLSVSSVHKRLTTRTKAIIPVHYAGLMCDMGPLMELAREQNLLVVEDCAHAIEAYSDIGKAGAIGDVGCFSFYVTKNLVTGEGGMALSKDDTLLNRVKCLALHGMSKDAWKRFGDDGYQHYMVTEAGFKNNMTDIQASLGIVQLKKLEKNWNRRAQISKYFDEVFQELPITLPAPAPTGWRHAHHLYAIAIKDHCQGRDSILNELHQKGIGTGVHYLALPEHPFYCETYGWTSNDYPVATDWGRSTISLPLSATLTDQDVNRIADTVAKVVS